MHREKLGILDAGTVLQASRKQSPQSLRMLTQ
jgi:hypothetical protein